MEYKIKTNYEYQKKTVGRVEVSFLLSAPGWYRLEKSLLWRTLEAFVGRLQNKDIQGVTTDAKRAISSKNRMKGDRIMIDDKVTKYKTILEDQIEMLASWNRTAIDSEPEQVRKNVEVIILAVQYLLPLERKVSL